MLVSSNADAYFGTQTGMVSAEPDKLQRESCVNITGQTQKCTDHYPSQITIEALLLSPTLSERAGR
jgi:hypothetical protein